MNRSQAAAFAGPFDGDPIQERERLVCAMTLVPSAFSRNKFFALFERPHVKHARARAANLRGVVEHLSNRNLIISDLTFERGIERSILAYRIESLAFARRVEMTALETVVVSFLLQKASVPGFSVGPDERARMDATLASLAPTQ
jgi:hypothetical protein